MPIFEYKCNECEKQFELLQSFSDSATQKCPYCGGEAQRLISSPSFQLKGGGWYSDGYCSTSKSNTTKNDSPTSSACAGCPNAK